MSIKEQTLFFAIFCSILIGAGINETKTNYQNFEKSIKAQHIFGNPELRSPEGSIPLNLTRRMQWTQEWIREAHAEEKDATQTGKLKEAPEKKYNVEDDIRQVFGDKAEEAIKIFKCESGLQSKCNDGLNRDGSVDCGVAQVNMNAHKVFNRGFLLEPEINIRIAKKIYDNNKGWGPWVCARKLGLI